MEFVWIEQMGLRVGKFEVTNGEYRKKEPGHDSRSYNNHSLNHDRQPVEEVSFDDAKAYAAWLRSTSYGASHGVCTGSAATSGKSPPESRVASLMRGAARPGATSFGTACRDGRLSAVARRQAGKSTMLRHLFADRNYVPLDNPFQRKLAVEDPRLFIEETGESVVIDQIQYAPELLSYIKMAVDEDRAGGGRFILTGSQFFPLMKNVGETLAGRVAVCELLPFSWREACVSRAGTVAETFETLWTDAKYA